MYWYHSESGEVKNTTIVKPLIEKIHPHIYRDILEQFTFYQKYTVGSLTHTCCIIS